MGVSDTYELDEDQNQGYQSNGYQLARVDCSLNCSRTFDGVCGEEDDVLSLQGIFVSTFLSSALGLRLSGQGRVVNLKRQKHF